MVPALPCPCRELLRWRSHALPAQSCSFLMLALDLIRVLRLPLARPHALRAAAQKDWPGARSSQDSCPLRKTICLSLVPGSREVRARFKMRRIVRLPDGPHAPFSQPGPTLYDSTKVLRAVLNTLTF